VKPLLRRCLEKDPKRRLRDIGEARFLLESGTGLQPMETAPSRSRLGWAAWAIAAVMTLIAGYALWPKPGELKPLIRLSVDLGPDSQFGPHITTAISPDGTRIAYPVRGANGATQLATRLLSQATPTVLAGTDGGYDPFFSPDGQWIGFADGAKLKKIS